MKRSKSIKIIGLLLVVVLVASFAACGTESANEPADSSSDAADSSGDATDSSGDAADSSSDGGDSDATEEQKEAEVITLRIGGAQPAEGFTWIDSINEYFIPTVDEALAETGNYTIEWVAAWGGTVATVGEVLAAVEGGLLDIGFVGNVFNASQLPLNNLSYYLPFNVRVQDNEQMLEAMKYMYATYPELYEEYEQYNNKILGLAVLESYNLITDFPVETIADLDGKKIGAAGANLNWFANTGVTAVQSPGTEAYSSIQTGVYNGTLQHTLMLPLLKLYEVAPYITLGDFGAVWGGSLTITSTKFDGLPQEVQDALVKAGEVYTDGTVELENKKLSTYKEDLEAVGATVTVLSDEQRSAWVNDLDNLPKEYAGQLDAQGLKGTEMMKAYIQALKDAGCELPREWFE